MKRQGSAAEAGEPLRRILDGRLEGLQDITHFHGETTQGVPATARDLKRYRGDLRDRERSPPPTPSAALCAAATPGRFSWSGQAGPEWTAALTSALELFRESHAYRKSLWRKSSLTVPLRQPSTANVYSFCQSTSGDRAI